MLGSCEHKGKRKALKLVHLKDDHCHRNVVKVTLSVVNNNVRALDGKGGLQLSRSLKTKQENVLAWNSEVFEEKTPKCRC